MDNEQDFLVEVREQRGGSYRMGMTRVRASTKRAAEQYVQLEGINDDVTDWGDWVHPDEESEFTTTGRVEAA